MMVEWDFAAGDPAAIPALIHEVLATYRAAYAECYARHASPDSPAQRDASPTVVLPSGCVLGTLTGPLATLPAFADTTLIAPACHDTASAIAGLPVDGDDWGYISCGTWSLVHLVAGRHAGAGAASTPKRRGHSSLPSSAPLADAGCCRRT